MNFKKIKLDFENTFVVFATGALLTGLIFLILYFLPNTVYLRIFFYRSWYVQSITTWLFCTAVLFVIFKYMRLKVERSILDNKVIIERLDSITLQHARDVLEKIPEKYRDTISFRRISELLRGYIHREEVVRLNQELSRRDVEQIEGGHLVLNSLKQLVPVLGFLGTVIGLSLGMVNFSDVSETVGNIESLRVKLKDLAASLSVAFDTTLLGLGYTIVLVLISSLLRRKEESFIADVDNKSRALITKLRYFSDAAERSEGSHDGGYGKEIVNALRQNGDAILKKLDELKDGLQKPPHYEIIVQPVKGKDVE